jgi:hypothetical protein
MKLYTLSVCYTPNERDAEGFVTDVFLYKLKEDALAKMKDQMDYKVDEIVYCEENVVMHGGNPSRPSGVIVARAKAYNYQNDVYLWEIRQYEIQ